MPGAPGRSCSSSTSRRGFGDVWTLAIADGRQRRQRVTGHFDRLERDFALPRQEKVEWKSADGATIEGMLFYPLDYQPGRRYPLVVQLHGGPMESDKFGAGPGLVLNYFPVLTGEGLRGAAAELPRQHRLRQRVLPRRVNGYFNNMHLGRHGGRRCIWCRRGIADPDRLIAMGWSAGGTLVNKLFTMTDRFKAASAGGRHRELDVALRRRPTTRRSGGTWFGGTPWQKNARHRTFWDSSPLKDVANVKTPTLLFAGEDDPRVPMAQSVEMYRALKSQRRADAALCRAARGALWGELRHRSSRPTPSSSGSRSTRWAGATSGRRRLSRNLVRVSPAMRAVLTFSVKFSQN